MLKYRFFIVVLGFLPSFLVHAGDAKRDAVSELCDSAVSSITMRNPALRASAPELLTALASNNRAERWGAAMHAARLLALAQHDGAKNPEVFATQHLLNRLSDLGRKSPSKVVQRLTTRIRAERPKWKMRHGFHVMELESPGTQEFMLATAKQVLMNLNTPAHWLALYKGRETLLSQDFVIPETPSHDFFSILPFELADTLVVNPTSDAVLYATSLVFVMEVIAYARGDSAADPALRQYARDFMDAFFARTLLNTRSPDLDLIAVGAFLLDGQVMVHMLRQIWNS